MPLGPRYLAITKKRGGESPVTGARIARIMFSFMAAISIAEEFLPHLHQNGAVQQAAFGVQLIHVFGLCIDIMRVTCK